MKHFFTILILLICSFLLHGQETFKLCPVEGLNTTNDDIACSLLDNSLLIMRSNKNDLVNDFKWNAAPVFHLYEVQRGSDFSKWTTQSRCFSHDKNEDEGPASFDVQDSVLYFSSAEKFGKVQGNKLKIYSIKRNANGWNEPILLSICDAASDFTHPAYDPSQKLLVFSSNRPGGFGNMDIWFMYKLESGWSEPVNPGMMVNSPANEIFPTIHHGDIYYSSNAEGGRGGYDLKKALQKEQWKSSVVLDAPVNSEADDVLLCYLSEEKALVTSNRAGGLGGDDIYLVERMPLPEEVQHYSVRLECDGKPLANALVTVTNNWQENIITEHTDAEGSFQVAPLKLNQSYRVQLGAVDPSRFTSCVLYFYDEHGSKIKEIRFNSNGFADLELLPLSYTPLTLLNLEDKSLLTVNIEGQLYDDKPGDVGRNEPVTILDDNGNPVAIAYTNETGKFRFTKVEPRLEYTFRLAEATAATHILVMEKGEKITLPVLKAEAHYQRVNPSEAIELVNEYNEKIVVSAKDLFVINRIYYEYNSAKLTSEASRQLDQLQIIMSRNPEITLELRSHTDARGNDDFNMSLSRKRANAAVQYLVSRGLKKERFRPVGLGESQLLNECDDGVECSEPEHSINRRTEIKLIRNKH